MLRATEGSILAACVADKLGWAVNLSGGFHHAHCESGGGFCIYPDITLTVHYIRTRLEKSKIMIVDLDAHQGNGHELDHLNDPNVYIVDFYNHAIYPNDVTAKRAIRRDEGINFRTTDDEFVDMVYSIGKDMDDWMPDFVIYNAGTDILDGDMLGRVHITRQGIIRRDEAMIEICRRRKIPVVMVLSGGYQLVNAEIIAESIENLLARFGKP
jgi:histone deacetylase 11